MSYHYAEDFPLTSSEWNPLAESIEAIHTWQVYSLCEGWMVQAEEEKRSGRNPPGDPESQNYYCLILIKCSESKNSFSLQFTRI